MSPKFVNTNAHPVRVSDGNGGLRRVVPGEVVDASGDLADALKSTPGVESAKQGDERSWESTQAAAAGNPSADNALEEIEGVPAAARRAAGLGLAAANQRVIGDDLAPLGPPTGTITTKQALATQDGAHRAAFADHEALPGEEVDGAAADPISQGATPATAAEVHNAQVAANTAVGEIASEAFGDDTGGDSDEGAGSATDES